MALQMRMLDGVGMRIHETPKACGEEGEWCWTSAQIEQQKQLLIHKVEVKTDQTIYKTHAPSDAYLIVRGPRRTESPKAVLHPHTRQTLLPQQ